MSKLRKYLRPTLVKTSALVAGVGLCLGILVNFPIARTQLESAINKVLPIGAALVPWFAFAGALFFGGVLTGGIVLWEVDRRRGGPAKREFMSKHGAIKQLRESLLALDNPPFGETGLEHASRATEVYTGIEILAFELDRLGIATPELLVDQKGDKFTWVRTLARLEGYACSGYLEAAIQFGDFWRPDSETA